MELLTGDCKNKFEEWYVITYLKHSEKYFNRNKYYVDIDIRGFYNTKQLSEQYGVLVDFFHQVDKSYSKKIYNEILSLITFEDKEPDEARKQAIQKANELFNNK